MPYIVIDNPIRRVSFVIDTGAEFSIIKPGVCNEKWIDI